MVMVMVRVMVRVKVRITVSVMVSVLTRTWMARNTYLNSASFKNS